MYRCDEQVTGFASRELSKPSIARRTHLPVSSVVSEAHIARMAILYMWSEMLSKLCEKAVREKSGRGAYLSGLGIYCSVIAEDIHECDMGERMGIFGRTLWSTHPVRFCVCKAQRSRHTCAVESERACLESFEDVEEGESIDRCVTCGHIKRGEDAFRGFLGVNET